MVFLHKLWDDVVAGPCPERGLDKLKRPNNLDLRKAQGVDVTAVASPATPTTPVTPSTPTSARKENVWRSVFHPGSNVNTKSLGAQIFDKPTSSSSPTVYDWLYSGESRSRHF